MSPGNTTTPASSAIDLTTTTAIISALPGDQHEPPSLPNSPIRKRAKPDEKDISEPLHSYNSTAMTTGEHGTMATTAVESLSLQPSSMSVPPLLVKRLSASARAPSRGSAFAAGYDLYSAKETVVPAKGKAMVDTGLAIAVPAGTCE